MKRTTISKWFSKQGYETIEPMEFYRFMFPEGELVERSSNPKSEEANQEWRYNGILLENTHKTKNVRKKDRLTGRDVYTQKEVWKNYMILNDLQCVQKAVSQYGNTDSEFFIAPMSYLGRRRNKQNERWMYACIIEVDHPIIKGEDGSYTYDGLKQLIHDWTASSMPYLMPSAIVSSGSGLHLIYFLDRPYQISDEHQKWQWDNFRKRFTTRIWNKYVTKSAIQQENHCQSFRVVGTRTKTGALVEAFWLSKKRYSIDELFGQFWFDDLPKWNTLDEFNQKFSSMRDPVFEPDEIMKVQKTVMPKMPKGYTPRMLEAQEQWPDWFERRVVNKMPRKEKGSWVCHRGLYDWYFNQAKQNAQVGCRYHRIHALAEYAVKCAIPYDEFKEDALELYQIFQTIDSKSPFHWMEFIKARDEYFNDKAHKSTRQWIENQARIPMKPPAKRNGQSQADHLEEARMIRDLRMKRQKRDWRDGNGRPDKASIVKQWRAEHPDDKKADCIRDTGLTKPTVYKWWDA